MNKKILLTEEKKEELEKELTHLEGEKSKEVMESLEQARRNDVSEDTEGLNMVLQEKEEIEKKVFDIRRILANFKLLTKKKCTPGKISIGSKIKVLRDGKESELRIVSSVEADPLKNYISDESPLGKALLKSKVGQTVRLKINDNKVEYKVLEVC
ncbi:MAG: GreA/GreB family elongation factor [Candidatus Dojkabacteria bacterium]|nr:GreA/GreB family elongation factor [Candidatus Dojkabacteria bacterium]